MPPSGFSQEAINGLLAFVSSTYENTLKRYEDKELSEEQILAESIGYLDGLVVQSVRQALDGTVSEEGIHGLRAFVASNYRDLVAEIYFGKKPYGKAIRTELDHIGKYLQEFKI